MRYPSLLLIAVFTMILYSCGNEPQMSNEDDCEEKIVKMELAKTILILQLQSDREIAQEITKTVHEVRFNSQQIIASKEKIRLELLKGKENSAAKKTIVHEMQKINLLQELNEMKIAELSSKDNAHSISMDISKIVEDLNVFSIHKKEGINQLKDQLDKLNFKLEQLNMSLDMLSFENEINFGVIELYEVESLSAYYCIDDYKTLNEKKIVERKGGVAGLGRVEMIEKDFNKSAFTRININKTTEIVSEAAKITVLSNHPKDSYEIKKVGNNQVISIMDVELFWNSTRYLVVVEKE